MSDAQESYRRVDNHFFFQLSGSDLPRHSFHEVVMFITRNDRDHDMNNDSIITEKAMFCLLLSAVRYHPDNLSPSVLLLTQEVLIPIKKCRLRFTVKCLQTIHV